MNEHFSKQTLVDEIAKENGLVKSETEVGNVRTSWLSRANVAIELCEKTTTQAETIAKTLPLMFIMVNLL